MRMPTLSSERVSIRELVLADLDDVFRIIDCECFGQSSPDDQVARDRRLEWLQWNAIAPEQQARLGAPPFGDRALVRNDDDQLIGVCGLVPAFGPFRRLLDGVDDDDYSAEVGLFYALGKDHRRKGYATEAARLLIQFAMETMGVHRVVATTERDNTASAAVMRGVGMSLVMNPLPSFPEVVGVLTK